MKPFRGLRCLLAATLIGLTAILLHARGRVEVIAPRPPFSLFPSQLDKWTSTDILMDKATLDVLGPGDFLVRSYNDPAPESNLPYAELFLAYFPSQRIGDTIHSPKNCLPGAGWTPEQSDRITISWPTHSPFPVNRYVISRNGARKLVLYWYWAHDRGVASEYWAKFYLVKDSIQMNRSDGALVRIVTNMFPGETAQSAQQRLYPFAADVVPLLDDYIPR